MAMGHFMAHYNNELDHIRSFQSKYLTSKKQELKYPYDENKNDDPKFWEFLYQFRIIRTLGIKNKQRNDFIKVFNSWDFNQCSPSDINRFCENGRLIKNHISLVSKIMMLANPWTIIPYDNQAKKAVGYKAPNNSIKYEDYWSRVNQFKNDNKDLLESMHKSVVPYAKIIEKDYDKDLKNIHVIRKKRLLDKVLWTYGV